MSGLLHRTSLAHGKTVEKIYLQPDIFCILFTDKTYMLVTVERDCEDSAYMKLNVEPSDWELLCASVITDEEYQKRAWKREQERQERQRKRELEQLERLKKKYE